MKPEIARRWADALESGQYKQARGLLCRVDRETGTRSYCCLGVLCELAIEDGVPVSVHEHKTEYGHGHVAFDKSGSYLPESVVKWAGADNANPKVGERGAVWLNDGEHWSFAQIAEAIRASINKVAA
jgi:hypothetical protein